MGNFRFFPQKANVSVAYWPGGDLGNVGANEHAVRLYQTTFQPLILESVAHQLAEIGVTVKDQWLVGAPLQLSPLRSGSFGFAELIEPSTTHVVIMNAARYTPFGESGSNHDHGLIRFDVRLWDVQQAQVVERIEPVLRLSSYDVQRRCTAFCAQLVPMFAKQSLAQITGVAGLFVADLVGVEARH
jgi:hypothetical protein